LFDVAVFVFAFFKGGLANLNSFLAAECILGFSTYNVLIHRTEKGGDWYIYP